MAFERSPLSVDPLVAPLDGQKLIRILAEIKTDSGSEMAKIKADFGMLRRSI
ncbi:hypothetical protein [Burkholderia sp. LMG 21824]|uniref:hypothetical protein n=1 Tax=Burkholderia sp. LMG 21824 TaxID=3158172 RepID=UPI003C2E4BBD